VGGWNAKVNTLTAKKEARRAVAEDGLFIPSGRVLEEDRKKVENGKYNIESERQIKVALGIFNK
jgi:hypothetical protein